MKENAFLQQRIEGETLPSDKKCYQGITGLLYSQWLKQGPIIAFQLLSPVILQRI